MPNESTEEMQVPVSYDHEEIVSLLESIEKELQRNNEISADVYNVLSSPSVGENYTEILQDMQTGQKAAFSLSLILVVLLTFLIGVQLCKIAFDRFK